MYIGVPNEIKNSENRVGLTPGFYDQGAPTDRSGASISIVGREDGNTREHVDAARAADCGRKHVS